MIPPIHGWLEIIHCLYFFPSSYWQYIMFIRPMGDHKWCALSFCWMPWVTRNDLLHPWVIGKDLHHWLNFFLGSILCKQPCIKLWWTLTQRAWVSNQSPLRMYLYKTTPMNILIVQLSNSKLTLNPKIGLSNECFEWTSREPKSSQK